MPLKASGLLTIQILLSLSAVKTLPLSPTLAEKLVSFLEILRVSELRYGRTLSFALGLGAAEERMGQIDFLNPSENSRLPSRRTMSLFVRNFRSD